MDVVSIAVAFALGFAARQVRLPPLVGYLCAGFVLHGAGVEGGAALEGVADLGVQLLLFGIGLKLDLRSLVRAEIWGVASIHALVTTAVFGAGLLAASLAGVGLLGGLDTAQSALLAFALSFSSTVFAVKVLEERGEMNALHGRVAIGILVLQDVFAIVFLVFSTNAVPSPWALALLALPLLRPAIRWVLRRCGHGELLLLFGLALVVAATRLFEVVDLKPDLGALLVGVVARTGRKSNELSKALLGLKDLLLVGFFLRVGLSGAPSVEGLAIAVALVALLPFKAALFFRLLTWFRLRARTALLGSLRLTNYSEFGLIVGAVSVANGWMGAEWLVIAAVTVSLSFALSAPINARAYALYKRLGPRLARYEGSRRIPGDEVAGPGDAEVVVFGMGRVGTGAYDALRKRLGDVVLGIDRSPRCVERQHEAGRRTVLGDPTDPDFLGRVPPEQRRVRAVLLTMRNHREKLVAIQGLREAGYTGTIAATALYADRLAELRAAGAESAFDLLAEAGSGMADEVCDLLGA